MRDEKIKKITYDLECQSSEARKRNISLLRKLGAEVSRYSIVCGKFDKKCRTGPQARLREAKVEYLRSIENMLPVYRINSTNKRLEKVRELNDMKEMVEKKRQLRLSLEQQDLKAQSLLDTERRDYLLQRSLEQRDELRINSRNLATKIRSREVDSAILQAVEVGLVAEQQKYQYNAQNFEGNTMIEKSKFMQKFHGHDSSSLKYHRADESVNEKTFEIRNVCDGGIESSHHGDGTNNDGGINMNGVDDSEGISDRGTGEDNENKENSSDNENDVNDCSDNSGDGNGVFQSPVRASIPERDQSSPYGFLVSSPSSSHKKNFNLSPSSSLIRPTLSSARNLESMTNSNSEHEKPVSISGPILLPYDAKNVLPVTSKTASNPSNEPEGNMNLPDYTQNLRSCFMYLQESIEEN